MNKIEIKKILKGGICSDCEFAIMDDGIYYIPLNGDGTEKDGDFFIEWEDLKKIFIEEREIYNEKRRKPSPVEAPKCPPPANVN